MFDHVVEGMFHRTLGKRLTPVGRAKLKEAGLDLEKPLRPAYPMNDYFHFLEIAALAIGSALAKDSNGKLDQTVVTRDGLHLAWSGTSAASPYVAGVVALLLQKNARLDAAHRGIPNHSGALIGRA